MADLGIIFLRRRYPIHWYQSSYIFITGIMPFRYQFGPPCIVCLKQTLLSSCIGNILLLFVWRPCDEYILIFNLKIRIIESKLYLTINYLFRLYFVITELIGVRDRFRSGWGGGGGCGLLPEYFLQPENQVVLAEYYLLFCPKKAIWKCLGGYSPRPLLVRLWQSLLYYNSHSD